MTHFVGPNLTRRGFITATGGLLALPLLESAIPRAKRAMAASAAPKRLVTVHMPCGVVMKNFTPSATGAKFPLSDTLSGLAGLEDQLLVLTNMQNDAAQNSAFKNGEGRHSKGLATLFTGANLQHDLGYAKAATSMDQIYAASVGSQTAVPSLQLGLADTPNDCDNNYACIAIRSMSWMNATTPLTDQVDPQKVFDTYLAGSATPEAAAQQLYDRSRRKSVLDAVLGQSASLQPKLSAADSQRLDQYLTGVRALETSLAAGAAAHCSAATRPADAGARAYQARCNNMLDLMALMLSCDLTRTISYNFGAGHCDQYLSFLPGVSDIQHSLSHNNGNAGMIKQLITIERWKFGQMGRFWKALKAIPEGDSTVLDNSVTLVSSEISDGNLHNYTDLPVLVAGRLGGAIASGRHVRAGSGDTYGNLTSLQLALLQALGVNAPSFGDFKQTTAMALT